jgi:DNA-3-methyladenine glycosylase II
MPVIDMDHHLQGAESLRPSESHRDADSDDAGMPKPTAATGKSDRWASGREALRAADKRMAELIDADPGLDPDALFDGWPSDLWGALVFQVIGQQLSRAAAGAILGRLEALNGNRLPTPAELLDTDGETLRRIGLSQAKAVYLHDLAARLEDGRLDLEQLRRFTADGVLMLALRRPDVWPAADLALRRAVERVWALDAPASTAQVDAIGERFRPWRTLAATYLYRTPTA